MVSYLWIQSLPLHAWQVDRYHGLWERRMKFGGYAHCPQIALNMMDKACLHLHEQKEQSVMWALADLIVASQLVIELDGTSLD